MEQISDTMNESEIEKMMSEISPIIEKYGYKNLGWQQTLDHSDLIRYIKGKICLNVVAIYDETCYTELE